MAVQHPLAAFLAEHEYSKVSDERWAGYSNLHQLLAGANESCDWCGGYLHGFNNGKCPAEAKIRVACGANVHSRTILDEYCKHRRSQRYSGALRSDLGSAKYVGKLKATRVMAPEPKIQYVGYEHGHAGSALKDKGGSQDVNM